MSTTSGRWAGSPAPRLRYVIRSHETPSAVLDLTCWAGESDPLLFALANSAASHIEERMRALCHESETALLEAYLQEA